jgi:HTH-type transcriptional regulator/antitoxin MqsA
MADESVYCPNCDAENSLSPFVYDREIEHAGKKLVITGLEASKCAVCGSDPVLADQVRRNRARYVDTKRRADGLLTSDEIVAVRSALSITQSEAAALFGGGSKAFSKYERGEVTQSVAMDRLMRIVTEVPGAEVWLRAEAGMVPGKIESENYGAKDNKVVNMADYRPTSVRVGTSDGPYEKKA